MQRPVNIFLAHAPQDAEMAVQFRQRMLALDQGLAFKLNIIHYDGTDMPSSVYTAYLQKADLVVLLVTKSFLTCTLYISEEVQHEMALAKQHKRSLVAMIMRDCWWEDTKIAALQILPNNGLPIEEAGEVKEKVYEQIMLAYKRILADIIQYRLEQYQLYEHYVKEAEAYFKTWEDSPENLLHARDFYEKAIEIAQPDCKPPLAVIEDKRQICLREIDFRYYANAVENAFKLKDYQGVLYHGKDALALRDDARIRKLIVQAEEAMEQARRALKFEPFQALIVQADEHFNRLDWLEAARLYQQATDFHHDSFTPSAATLKEKIALCHREANASKFLAMAKAQLEQYDYDQTLHFLDETLKARHPEAIEMLEYCKEVNAKINALQTFQDKDSLFWGFYDIRNNVVVIPARYTEVYSFSEGLAAVRKRNKWGFIDHEGQIVIPIQFDHVAHFNAGKAEVVLNEKRYFITKSGKELTSLQGELAPPPSLQGNKEDFS